jgi:CubicO group peptidase (beta-lactamase class C family)
VFALVLLALAIVGCNPSAKLQAEFVRPDGIGAEYQKLFDEYRESIPKEMDEHKIPGLSIAVVDRGGFLWTAGFGRTGKGNQPVTPETLFSIQSMSKTFIATAVMMAVQDGLLNLDAPITKYLPDFKVKSRFEDNPQEKITLRHLLSHKSGLTHEAPVGNNFDTRYETFEEHVLSIQDTWLKYRVGEKYSYSNLGIDLAAYILQVQSGKSFAEYMKLKVFDPMGMPNSSVDYAFVERHSNRARGHLTNVVEVPVAIPMVAAGGVYSSAKELPRFVEFYLNRGTLDGRAVLDSNLVDAIYTSSPVSQGYGLGIAIGKKHDTYYLNHDGGGFGFLSTMTWYPEYGIGCVVLTNSMGHNEQNVKVSNDILDELITQHIVKKGVSKKIPPADKFIGKDVKLPILPDVNSVFVPTPYQPQWKRYVGTYRFIKTGYKLDLMSRLALCLGYCPRNLKMTVEKKDGYLCIGDEKLLEYRSGLFFTSSGEALDFQGSMPTWRNIKMETSPLLWSL